MDLGVNLVIATYRGYGGSGGVPQLAAMLKDVPALFAALQTPAKNLVVVGRSLGLCMPPSSSTAIPKWPA